MWKLFEIEIVCLKLIGFQFHYSDTKKDKFIKFWAGTCLFTFFMIPFFGIYHIIKNGFTVETIMNSNHLIHSIIAALRLMVYYNQRKSLEKLLNDLRILHDEGNIFFPLLCIGRNKSNHSSQHFWKHLTSSTLLPKEAIR